MKKNFTKMNSISRVYKKIVFIFVVLTIILVSIALYFSLSQAKIYIQAKSQPAKINFTTQVKEDVEDNNYLETNILPGRVLELVMEKTQDFEVQGVAEEAERYGGTMKVYNNKSEDQVLIARTRFESENGNIFRISKKVTIPAKSFLEVEVLADEAGEEYKEPAGKFTLPGFKNEYSRTNVYGETQEEMTKKQMVNNILTDQDIQKARESLIVDLKKDSLHKMSELLVAGEKLEEEAIITEVISEEISEKVGAEVDSFQYNLQIKLVGVIFNKDELLTLAQSFLSEQLNSNQQLINYDNNSLIYNITNYVAEEKNATLEVELSAQVIQKAGSGNFEKENLKGLTQQEIIEYFSEQPAIESIEVVFSPFWVKKAPQMSDHIEIIINNE